MRECAAMATNAKKPDLAAFSLTELRELESEVQTAITEKEAAEKAAILAEFEQRAKSSGFSLADILALPSRSLFRPKKDKAKAEESAKGRGSVAPKYRNPENSLETWSGRGRQPVWVRDQIANGKTLDDLAIAQAAE